MFLCIIVPVIVVSMRIPAVFNHRGFLSINVTDTAETRDSRLVELDSVNEVTLMNGSLGLIPTTTRQSLMNSLVSNFGSVAILRNDDVSIELFLNFTDEDFTTFCVPNSTVSVPLFRGAFLGEVTGTTASLLPLSAVEFFLSHRQDYIFEMPRLYYIELIRMFQPIHDFSPYRVATVHNCDRENLLYMLEDLVIVTITGHSIRLSPDDYIDFLPNGSCRLKIVDTCNDAFIPIRSHFNPLAIPNINILRTPNSIAFCDSL